MSYCRIVIVDYDVEGPDATDAVVRTLRELLGRGGTQVFAVEQSEPVLPAPPSPAPAKPSPPAPVIYEPPPPRPPAPQTTKPTVERTRPRVHTNRGPDGGPSIASKIIAAFRVNQATTKADLAKAIYGNSLPESLQKLQSQIYMLTNTGRLNRLGVGRYEVVS